jgi:hypothetical protein
VVFDYPNPPDTLSARGRAAHEARARRVAALGEPWLSYFGTDELAADLRAIGFTGLDDLGPAAIGTRYFGLPAGGPQRSGGHVIAAHRPVERTLPHDHRGLS